MPFDDLLANDIDAFAGEVGPLLDTCALNPVDSHRHLMHFPDGNSLDVHAGLFHDPGSAGGLHDFMNQPDPLTNMSSYSFPGVTYPSDADLLVDSNHDGIPDHTKWGTKVIHVEPYMRSDGTWVRGHFRTTPDGFVGNNLSANR